MEISLLNYGVLLTYVASLYVLTVLMLSVFMLSVLLVCLVTQYMFNYFQRTLDILSSIKEINCRVFIAIHYKVLALVYIVANVKRKSLTCAFF